MAINWNLISIIVFAVAVCLFLYKNRKKIEIQSKILFLYKTQRPLKWIDALAKYKRFWKIFGLISIPAGFIGMAVIFVFLFKQLSNLSNAAVQIIGPGIGNSATSIGPILLIPVWYLLISLIVVMIVHEGAHGVVARSLGIKLKSAGFGFLAILPLAFVEPDEEQLSKAKLRDQLSVFAAGPFANFVTAAILILISILFIIPHGLYVESVVSGMPAQQAGIARGDVILSVNDNNVTSSSDFVAALVNVSPGEQVIILTDNGEKNVITVAKEGAPEGAYLGVNIRPNYITRSGLQIPKLFNPIMQLISWLIALNLGIGLINLLPLGPIDGGRMLSATLKKKISNKNVANKIFTIITLVSVALLVINLVGPHVLK